MIFKIVTFWQFNWNDRLMYLLWFYPESGAPAVTYLSVENLAILPDDHQPEVRIRDADFRVKNLQEYPVQPSRQTTKSVIDHFWTLVWQTRTTYTLKQMTSRWGDNYWYMTHVNYELKSDNLLVTIPAGICNAICDDRLVFEIWIFASGSKNTFFQLLTIIRGY